MLRKLLQFLFKRWLPQMNDQKRIHFIGIGGAGMSAIAWVLLKKGMPVSGSDVYPSDRSQRLREHGAIIYDGHSPENLQNVGLVVVSSAIMEDNPELAAAHTLKIPVWHRSAMLAELLHEGDGVCIAGTHGKTTTTGMTSLIMERAGLDPSVLIGSELPALGGNARYGAGRFIIAESDESDGSFLNYHPLYAAVLNIESEHMEHYKTEETLKNAFRTFLSQVRPEGAAVLCADDAGVRSILDGEPPCRIVLYSVKLKQVDFFAGDIVFSPLGSEFSVYQSGKRLGAVSLQVPGIHNVSNALAATALAMTAGVKFSDVRSALADFTGTGRRFQIRGRREGVIVVDDYAHHPTEILATIKSALPLRESRRGRIITVFQPHRYTRTRDLADAFGVAFHDSDIVIITDVYSAGEPPIPGISGKTIYDAVVQSGHPNVLYVPRVADVTEKLLQMIVPGDIIFTMGAGNIWKMGESFLKRLGGVCMGNLKA